MGLLPNHLQPRARATTRIQLPLDTTRRSLPGASLSGLSLPAIKARHAYSAAEAMNASPVCGCLSGLSIPFVQRADFKNAVAEFAGLRQGAIPTEYNNVAVAVPHTFSSMADIEAANDVLDAMPVRLSIDSDLIEECGYFGWLA